MQVEQQGSSESVEQAVHTFCTKSEDEIRHIVAEVYNNVYGRYNGKITFWSLDDCITFFMAHYIYNVKEQAWCREYGYNILQLH